MKLLIHDLSREEWEKISHRYPDVNVIADDNTIRPCNGCFSCWNRTPGECVIKDGYENMGRLIHHSEEVIVISRYTYGGFSSFVKNVFDRCLGYVLPQFEVVNSETHHKKRYDEDKAFIFVFYGPMLSDEDKDAARTYVQAVCANIRGHVEELIFEDIGSRDEKAKREKGKKEGKIVLLNPSMRYVNGNSQRLALKLKEYLNKDCQVIALQKYGKDKEGLYRELADASSIVLCTPLYIDGLPSQMIRFMEEYEKGYKGPSKKIYILANMGLYESSQLKNLFSAVRRWCEKMDFEYCGGMGVSAGELIGTLMEHIPFPVGPGKKMAAGMRILAQSVEKGERMEDIYREPYMFPRSLYILIANKNWDRTAVKNGIRKEDLYRQL